MSLPEPRTRASLVTDRQSSQRLDQDLRTGRSAAVFRGVHIDARLAGQLRVRAAAALLTQGSDAVLSHRPAAVLLGLRWLPAAWGDGNVGLEVTVPASDSHRHRSGLRLHRRTLRASDVVMASGLPCTSPARTLIELARDPRLPVLLLVQIIDGALRDRRCSLEDLAGVLDSMRGERYVERARRVVMRGRTGVDSPKETELRLTLEDGGIRDLDIGIEIRDHDGIVLARGDLGSRRLLLWGEYDGFDTHAQRPQFRGDRVGDRWLSRRGWHVLRFVDDDLARARRTCDEWRAAALAAPARIAALAPSTSPEVAAARRTLGLDL
jgi:hypothetical protein